jgi:hypothetical protein
MLTECLCACRKVASYEASHFVRAMTTDRDRLLPLLLHQLAPATSTRGRPGSTLLPLPQRAFHVLLRTDANSVESRSGSYSANKSNVPLLGTASRWRVALTPAASHQPHFQLSCVDTSTLKIHTGTGEDWNKVTSNMIICSIAIIKGFRHCSIRSRYGIPSLTSPDAVEPAFALNYFGEQKKKGPEAAYALSSLIFSWTRFSFSSLVSLGVLYLSDSFFHSSLVFLVPSLSSSFFHGSSRMALWASV